MVAVRPISPAEVEQFRTTARLVFHGDPDPDWDEHSAHVREEDRMIAAFEGNRIVGTVGAYSLDLAVPGGLTVATAGTTAVTVLPTHRRRGILRLLMEAHLEEATHRQEPLAALWASEATIYRRFGYGAASEAVDYEIDRRDFVIVDPPDSYDVQLFDAADALPHLEAVYDRAHVQRPGTFRRSRAWWEHRRLLDLPQHRGGASAIRVAVVFDDEAPAAYAIYRVKEDWVDNGLPTGTLRAREVVGVTAEAELAALHFLAQVDLVGRITATLRPPDDPLFYHLADSRPLKQTVIDGLWVRLLDVPAALGSRRYRHAEQITIAVRDGAASAAYTLEVDADGNGACSPTDAQPDVSLDLATLGSLYLGGADARALHRHGFIHGTGDASWRLHQIFSWDPAPWCPEIF